VGGCFKEGKIRAVFLTFSAEKEDLSLLLLFSTHLIDQRKLIKSHNKTSRGQELHYRKSVEAI
jgi:hypothetical protein